MRRQSKPFASMKGFIGPIGDDLPSLVPIVVSLLLFFTTFTLALNTYNTKNALLNQQTEMTSVARELKGDSLILGVDWFEEKCKSLKMKRYPNNFIAAIYDSDVDMSVIMADFLGISASSPTMDPTSATLLKSISQSDGSPKPFYCEYRKVGAQPFAAGSKKKYQVRFYPVAVQYGFTLGTTTSHLIIPGLMAMVVWE